MPLYSKLKTSENVHQVVANEGLDSASFDLQNKSTVIPSPNVGGTIAEEGNTSSEAVRDTMKSLETLSTQDHVGDRDTRDDGGTKTSGGLGKQLPGHSEDITSINSASSSASESQTEWNHNDLDILSILGDGDSTMVYKVKQQTTGRIMARKVNMVSP